MLTWIHSGLKIVTPIFQPIKSFSSVWNMRICMEGRTNWRHLEVTSPQQYHLKVLPSCTLTCLRRHRPLWPSPWNLPAQAATGRPLLPINGSRSSLIKPRVVQQNDSWLRSRPQTIKPECLWQLPVLHCRFLPRWADVWIKWCGCSWRCSLVGALCCWLMLAMNLMNHWLLCGKKNALLE